MMGLSQPLLLAGVAQAHKALLHREMLEFIALGHAGGHQPQSPPRR